MKILCTLLFLVSFLSLLALAKDAFKSALEGMPCYFPSLPAKQYSEEISNLDMEEIGNREVYNEMLTIDCDFQFCRMNNQECTAACASYAELIDSKKMDASNITNAPKDRKECIEGSVCAIYCGDLCEKLCKTSFSFADRYMTYSEENVDSNMKYRKESIFASDELLGSIVLKSIDLLGVFIMSNADKEKMKPVMDDLEKDLIFVKAHDDKREESIRDLIFDLSDSIGIAMGALAEKQTDHGQHYPVVEANPTFDCNVCGKSFNRKGNLKTHEQTHLVKGIAKSPYKCEICEKRFTSKAALKGHYSTHLADDDPLKRQFECDNCGMKFTCKTSLQGHMRRYLSDENVKLPHQCDECGRRFSILGNLKVHKITHLAKDDSRRKAFKCETCDKTFSVSYSLRKHKLTHLEDSDPRKNLVECDLCGYYFASSASLKNHKLTHLDGSDPEQAKLKWSYECDICGRKFTTGRNRQVHMRTHDRSNDKEAANKNERLAEERDEKTSNEQGVEYIEIE